MGSGLIGAIKVSGLRGQEQPISGTTASHDLMNPWRTLEMAEGKLQTRNREQVARGGVPGCPDLALEKEGPKVA